ncbi:MAG: hypothetical protein KDC35_09715 [Acidobacteria bacterium]|nr:hypothetical protein [Acidobacteriota bacterium]
MQRLVDQLGNCDLITLKPGACPENIPDHQGFIWVDGAFPFMTAELLQQLIDQAPAALFATNLRPYGVRAENRSMVAEDRDFFDRSPSRNTLDVDPLALQALVDATTYADLNAYAYEVKRRDLMQIGVLMPIAENVYVDRDACVAPGATLHPGAKLEGRTRVGAGSSIGMGSLLIDAEIGESVEVRAYCVIDKSTVDNGAAVGPFAHLRPGTHLGPDVRVGNFVETKNAKLGQGSKASHLSYLGDAEIGRECNIGAGTITCNYDGVHKNITTLGDRVFIGSDSQLVAPIHLGDDAYVAAGTTVTRDVEAGALAIARTRQTNKAGWSQLIKDKAKTR